MPHGKVFFLPRNSSLITKEEIIAIFFKEEKFIVKELYECSHRWCSINGRINQRIFLQSQTDRSRGATYSLQRRTQGGLGLTLRWVWYVTKTLLPAQRRKLLWRSDKCVSIPGFNAQPDIFAVTNCCVVALSVFSSDIATWSADSLYSAQWHII